MLDEIHSENFSSSSKEKSKNFDSFNKTEKPKNLSKKDQKKKFSDDLEPIHIQKSHKRGVKRKNSIRGYSSIMSKMSSSKLSSGKVYFTGKNSSSIINRMLLFPDKKVVKRTKVNKKVFGGNKNVSIKKLKKNLLKKIEPKMMGSSFKVKKRTSKSTKEEIYK